MKKTKQIMSLLLAVFMMVMTVVPVMAADVNQLDSVVGEINEDNLTKEKQDTELVIHKLKAEKYNQNIPTGEKGGIKHNGGLLSQDMLKKLGTNVEELDDVTFSYYLVKDQTKFEDMVNNPANYKTKNELADTNNFEYKDEIKTKNKNGATLNLPEGNYWFIETGKPDTVSSAIAVPFGISLPLTNQIKVGNFEIGTAYLKKVHVYPKNIEAQFPEIDKDVKEIGNKNDSSKVGDIVPWIINVTVPTNIKDYEEYKITDQLDNALDFVLDSIKVYYEKDIQNVEGLKTKTELYTGVTKSYDEGKRTITVEFSKNKGIPELAKSVEEGKKVYVYFETKINDKAVMGQPIPNNAKITFKNRPDSDGKTKEIPEPKRPKTVTGGKKFVKVDFSNNDTKLKGAEFVVINKKDKDMILTTQGTTYKWEEYEANNIPETAVKLKSAEVTGAFEIKGLEYSEWKKQTWDVSSSKLVEGATVTNNYRLVEVKAPEGYALIEDKENNGLNFIVNADSYKEETGVLEVKNKKITIPQTGGIGTLIFTVAGIALMAGAAFALKKNAKED